MIAHRRFGVWRSDRRSRLNILPAGESAEPELLIFSTALQYQHGFGDGPSEAQLPAGFLGDLEAWAAVSGLPDIGVRRFAGAALPAAVLLHDRNYCQAAEDAKAAYDPLAWRRCKGLQGSARRVDLEAARALVRAFVTSDAKQAGMFAAAEKAWDEYCDQVGNVCSEELAGGSGAGEYGDNCEDKIIHDHLRQLQWLFVELDVDVW